MTPLEYAGISDTDMNAIIDIAFEVNAAMADIRDDNRGQFVRELFDGADVVWCVWRDGGEPDLFHCEVVKGADRAGDVGCTALLVSDSDFAGMVRARLGDGVTHATPVMIQ